MIVSKFIVEVSFTVVTYDQQNMFIIQATGFWQVKEDSQLGEQLNQIVKFVFLNSILIPTLFHLQFKKYYFWLCYLTLTNLP